MALRVPTGVWRREGRCQNPDPGSSSEVGRLANTQGGGRPHRGVWLEIGPVPPDRSFAAQISLRRERTSSTASPTSASHRPIYRWPSSSFLMLRRKAERASSIGRARRQGIIIGWRRLLNRQKDWACQRSLALIEALFCPGGARYGEYKVGPGSRDPSARCIPDRYRPGSVGDDDSLTKACTGARQRSIALRETCRSRIATEYPQIQTPAGSPALINNARNKRVLGFGF